MSESRSPAKLTMSAALPVVLAHSLLAPFWFSRAYATDVWFPPAAVLLAGIAAPAYLAWLGCRLILRPSGIPLWFGLGVLAGALVLDFLLDYTLWGVSSGHFWTPDQGTLWVIQIMAVVAVIIFMLPVMISLLLRYRIERSNLNA
jgi:hypothetical protein